MCELEYYSRFQAKFLGLFTFFERHKNVDANTLAIRKFTKEDVDSCLDIINSYSPKPGLYRRWERDELLWELENVLSATYVFIKNQTPVALISYHILDIIGRTEDKIAQVDNVFVDELTLSEKRKFINYLSMEINKLKLLNYSADLQFTNCKSIYTYYR
ncbi:MAG: hypothetical protein IPO21_17855 [Bacteroidales bacterium]|nr:hypothetical protein [Bacteroidales bacterium]